MSSTQQQGDTAVAEKQKVKEPSKYNIIVHNNDFTSYDEVIYVVSKAFEMDEQSAYKIASTVHHAGKGICGTYYKEVAETKMHIVDMVKESLVAIMPFRRNEIMMLKFTMEKA